MKPLDILHTRKFLAFFREKFCNLYRVILLLSERKETVSNNPKKLPFQ